jgi:hypothetical protein
MWVVAKTKSGVNPNWIYHNRLYAIDIATGADRPGSPVDIQASCAGTANSTGFVSFDPHVQMNRPALLLLDGRIYIGFGSHDDAAPNWHGWVLAYDATTLKQVGVFCTTPNTDPSQNMGSVWQSGMGLAADPEGFVYFVTGNGDSSAGNYGDTVVKLAPDFTVKDYFTPYNNQQELFPNDWDFGSGGPLILPDPPAGSGFPNAMVACGKFGQIYLIDRNKMGKYNAGGPPDHVLQFVPLPGVPALLQEVKQQKQSQDFGNGGGPGVWGGPAYFDNVGQQFVYYCGNAGPLTAFVFSGNSLAQSQIGANPNQSAMTFPSCPPGSGQGGGTTPVVSSNGKTDGIVWALVRASPLQLVAFDATNLTTGPLFGPVWAGPWNTLATPPKPNGGGAFTEPTVIQGKVYVPSDGQLNVFGL